MDTEALGGVIIKKMLKDIGVKTYDFTSHGGEKADALFQLQLLLQEGRRPVLKEREVVEENPNYGSIKSYYIPDMEDELASYELEDKKLTQDYVVALMMFSWFINKRTRVIEPATFVVGRNKVFLYNKRKEELNHAYAQNIA